MKKRFYILMLFIFIFTLSTSFVFASNSEWDEYGWRVDAKPTSFSLDDSNTISSLSSRSHWSRFDTKRDVHLTKDWTIEFSHEIERESVSGMNIVKGNEFIPVTISITEGEKSANIKPVNPYMPNETYSVLIFLNNGNRYKMDFITSNYGDIESNNTINTSGQINLGEPVKGYIDGDDDDYYFLDVLESGRLDISASRYDTNNINLNLSILGDTDRELVLHKDEANRTGSGGNQNSTRNIVVDVEPGTYYIALDTRYSSSHNIQPGFSGEYQLNINFTK